MTYARRLLPAAGTPVLTDNIAALVGGLDTEIQVVKWVAGAEGLLVPISLAAGAVDAGTLRHVLASDDPAVVKLGLIEAVLTAVKDATANAIGTLLKAPDGTPLSVEGFVPVKGDLPHGDDDAEPHPVLMGGDAVNAEPTPAAANARSRFITDLVGKLISLPYTNPENMVRGVISTAMTGTASTSLVAAPAAGLRNYITSVLVSNAHPSVGTDVVLQDGNSGTILGVFPAAPAYGGSILTLPVPIRQPTAATAIFAANVTTGASTKVSAYGYKGV